MHKATVNLISNIFFFCNSESIHNVYKILAFDIHVYCRTGDFHVLNIFAVMHSVFRENTMHAKI